MKSTNLSPEEHYLRLRKSVETMPGDLYAGRISPESLQWLGEASFLVESSDNLPDIVAFTSAVGRLGSVLNNMNDIPFILHKALARAEALAPATSRGTFIAAGSPMAALISVSKILSEAKSDVLVVDAYAEANLLSDYLVFVPESAAVRVLSDAKTVKATLRPTAESWIKQHGSSRPLEVRLTPKGSIHDRLIILDGTIAWTLGQSFNHLAERAPTSLMKADDELARMKVEAYAALWRDASILAATAGAG